MVNRRPVYENAAGRSGSGVDCGEYQLWRAGNTLWQVGHSNACGKNLAIFSVSAEGAALPTGLRGWRVVDEKGRWHDAPELRCVSDAALRTELLSGAATVHLIGADPENTGGGQGGLRPAG